MLLGFMKKQSLFFPPNDSRIIGVHNENPRWTTMKVLSQQKLQRRALKIELGSGNVVFMVILHSIY